MHVVAARVFRFSVIPAQAGIQIEKISLRSKDRAEEVALYLCRNGFSISWVPACAGMTKFKFLVISLNVSLGF